MKNKNKSSKVQKFIATVQQQQANAGQSKEAVSMTSCRSHFPQLCMHSSRDFCLLCCGVIWLTLQMAKKKLAEDRAKAKEAELQRKKMDAQLYGPVQAQKVPFGTGECTGCNIDEAWLTTCRPQDCMSRKPRL
jgi:hypothetical protein